MNKSDNKPKIECNHEYEKRPEDVGITCKHCWLLKTTIERKEMENQPKETTEDWEEQFNELFVSIYGETDEQGKSLTREEFVDENPIEVKDFIKTLISRAKEQERKRWAKELLENNRDEIMGTVDFDGIAEDVLSELEEVGE